MATRSTIWRSARGEPFVAALAVLLTLVVRAMFRVRVLGAERLPSGPVLLAANHISYLDPLVAAVVLYRLGRTVRFLAASELFSKPLLGWVLRRAGQIPVVRGAGAEAMAVPACRALERGETVLVYPEGTIPPPGQRPPARRGAGVLALRTSAPVIPMAMCGMELSRLRRVPIRRGVAVVFGEPLDLAAWRGRQDHDAAQRVSDLMLASVRGLLPRARAVAAGRVEGDA